MLDRKELNIDYKIAPPESLSIIGSNSISTSGDLYVVHINSIAKENNRYNKRAFDMAIALFLLLVSPVMYLLIKNKSGLFANIIDVLSGRKSWVGYYGGKQTQLPELKKGVLSPASIYAESIPEKMKEELNMVYAKNYRLLNDLEIITKAWRKIGQS